MNNKDNNAIRCVAVSFMIAIQLTLGSILINFCIIKLLYLLFTVFIGITYLYVSKYKKSYT